MGVRVYAAEMLEARAHLSDREIGKVYGVSGARVNQILGPRGTPYRRRSEEFIEAARALWDKGLSLAAIGCRLGVTKDVIVGVHHRNGFAPRPTIHFQANQGDHHANRR